MGDLNTQEQRDCIFCFQPNTMVERLTKHGKPYASCRACGTRAFFHDASALNGPALLAALLTKVGARRLSYIVASDGEAALKREVARLAEGVATMALSTPLAPPTGGSGARSPSSSQATTAMPAASGPAKVA